MLRRTNLIGALVMALASMSNWAGMKASLDSPKYQPGSGQRASGKGKDRMGARKAFHAIPPTKRDHGKPARRRRRAARLKRK